MIGSSLNQYRITATIGAGGMGEVFRARGTRLNRDVAMKVLAKDFASDADRLRRFEQEAKTLVAPNHPNGLAKLRSPVAADVRRLTSKSAEKSKPPDVGCYEEAKKATIRINGEAIIKPSTPNRKSP